MSASSGCIGLKDSQEEQDLGPITAAAVLELRSIIH